VSIAFLIRDLNYGGAQRQLVVLGRELHKRGYPVVVVVCYPDGPLEKDLRRFGVPTRTLDKRGRWDVFGFLLRLVRLLRQERPDLLYAWLGLANILAVLSRPILPGTRVATTVSASYLDFAHYDWLESATSWTENRLTRFADLIVSNSHAGRRDALARGFPADKIRVVPNGIDTERFRADPEARVRVRGEWDVAEEEKLIGLVGRLDAMKDHPTFLRAAALLVREREDARFVCVGDGPADYFRELRALGERLGLAGRLVWAGAREDMPAVYSALDIACSSSAGEGLPNVIGEAMACGVPCVVTDVGDSRWVVGETGFVVSPKDPQGLARSLQKAITLEEEDELDREAIRQRIIDNFSLGAFVERSVEALEGA
jgi:glycosyltransferase involved in cell wall biosynthesis